MTRLLAILCFLNLISVSSRAQQQDSARAAIQSVWQRDSMAIYAPKKVAFDLIIDNRKSFIRDKQVDIAGLNVGLIFRNKYRLGLGWYNIKKDFKFNRPSSNGSSIKYRDLEMQYGMINFEYWLVNRKYIEVAIPLEIGFGFTKYIYRAEDNLTVINSRSGLFIPGGVGLQLKIKPIRWIGLNGLVGYRKSLKTYDINTDFDGIFYSYGVSVFLGRIINDLKFLRARDKYRKSIRAVESEK